MGKRKYWELQEDLSFVHPQCSRYYWTGGMQSFHLRGQARTLKPRLAHVGAFNLSPGMRQLLGVATSRERKNKSTRLVRRFDRAHSCCDTKPHRAWDLAAATATTVRLSRMIVLVLRWILFELLLASGTAKGICLSSMLGVPSGGSDIYLHAANRILHSGGTAHTVLRDS